MSKNFGRNIAYLGLDAAATATGSTGNVSGTIYDLQGYTGVVFICPIGATATNNFLVAKGGSATASMSDIAGSVCTGHTTMLMLELHQPHTGRYVQPQLRLGTSAHYGPILAFGLGAENLPVTNSSLLTYKFVNHPVSGTATSS